MDDDWRIIAMRRSMSRRRRFVYSKYTRVNMKRIRTNRVQLNEHQSEGERGKEK